MSGETVDTSLIPLLLGWYPPDPDKQPGTTILLLKCEILFRPNFTISLPSFPFSFLQLLPSWSFSSIHFVSQCCRQLRAKQGMGVWESEVGPF